jgi:nitroimidazol reductase NimA-like FMN-containing flavoprotein (pyridoxamine 5'-phosphate oxidase superfamily)
MGVELTAPEIDAYLQAAPRCILCVSRDGHPPLPLPMWFGWIDGRIVMSTLAASKKVAHLRKHPQVACLVESGEDYFALKSVLIMGRCEVVEDDGAAREWMKRIEETKPLYRSLKPERFPGHLERFYQRPRVALLVAPSSLTSWDFAKIPR